jgi:hypothetical protein
MARKRILYLVHGYPVPSQTYILNEIDLVSRDYDVAVVATAEPEPEFRPRHYLPYTRVEQWSDAIPIAKEFEPDFVHTQWIRHIADVAEVARAVDVPFTVRSHSFDVLTLNNEREVSRRDWRRRRHRMLARKRKVEALNSPDCVGVLGFEFAGPLLRQAGAKASKFIVAPPVLRFERFDDRSPNGEGVMVIGPEDRNRNIDWVCDLAAAIPELPVRLYGMEGAAHLVGNHGGPPNLEVMTLIDPEDMAPHYKWARWLVTGFRKMNDTLGWKMSTAEAWASGTGVCTPALRPDLSDYVGDAGVMYRDLSELPEVLSGPVPDAQREAGFAKAKPMALETNLHLLTDLWDRAS